MKNFRLSLIACALVLAVAACSDSPTRPDAGQVAPSSPSFSTSPTDSTSTTTTSTTEPAPSDSTSRGGGIGGGGH